jgi:putative transposase
VIDSQVVKTTPVGGPERGYDGAKRIAGRKRHILLVDTNNGLVLAARVHGADLPDRDGGRRRLLDEQPRLPRLELVWADGAYTGGFREWAEEERGWRVVEVPYHRERQLWRYGLEEKPRGFSWSCQGGRGWWSGPSPGWGYRRGGSARTTTKGCPRPRRR